MKKILIDGEYVSSDNIYEYDGLLFVYDFIYSRIHVYKNDEYIDYFDVLKIQILDLFGNIIKEDFADFCINYIKEIRK